MLNINSRFRKLQNNELQLFAKSCKNMVVYELGGTFNENNKIYYLDVKNYIISNIDHKVCDIVEDVTSLSFSSDSIERIVCISVLQHIYDYNKAISEIIRVLKPGGKALITNGFLFPICMQEDYVRLTPRFWERRLQEEAVKYEIKKLGNRYSVMENLLMRPYGRMGGLFGLINKVLAQVFKVLSKVQNKKDSYPLGLAVYIEKNN
jgi:SAM-dependent methyltransferase